MSKMIEDLMHPSAFPENPKNILFVQTHISTVFIGDEFVYKIKKPVNFGFLDFSTLEKRAYYCNKEFTLNNRFSKDVYLGVYPVNFDGKKHVINGKGKIVDYAVKMKRLPDELLMKSKFKKDNIKSVDIKKIGHAIANFHKKSDHSKEIAKFGKISAIKLNTNENFQQTSEFINNSISREQFQSLKEWTDNFYRSNQELFFQRIRESKIRDCHGDLHMEHVCLTDPIIIFDCIEFNDRFRYIDTLSDIAFLLMDLDFNGGKDLSRELCEAYLLNADEKDKNYVYSLINFYKVYRAYVRGKVNSLILKDIDVPIDKKLEAKKTAKKYFTLAQYYISK